MKENFADNVELTITGSGAEMEGVARLDGMAVFVPGALPGERVRAHITKRAAKFARAELDEVLEVSPDRCTPECPHAGRSADVRAGRGAYARGGTAGRAGRVVPGERTALA